MGREAQQKGNVHKHSRYRSGVKHELKAIRYELKDLRSAISEALAAKAAVQTLSQKDARNATNNPYAARLEEERRSLLRRKTNIRKFFEKAHFLTLYRVGRSN